MKTSIRFHPRLVPVVNRALPTMTGSPCDTWNSPEFLNEASVQDIEKRVQDGADLEARDEHGWTLLHLTAMTNDNPQVIISLVGLGTRSDARDAAGRTPLHLAVFIVNHPDVITLLLEHGADLAARSRNGCTPLHYAAKANKSDVVTRLLELGAYGMAKRLMGRRFGALHRKTRS